MLSNLPVGFLLTVLILGVATVCALWPKRAPGPLGTGMYLAGMGVNEIPLVAALWAVPGTVLTLADDDPLTPGGILGAVILVVAWVGLGVVAYRAVRSADVPEAAMRASLGTDWRSGVEPGRPNLLRAFLLPFLRRRRDVERVRNIAYDDGGRRHLLDVYRHRSRPQGCPVFAHFHGGHFVSGAKNRESLPLLYHLASRGWLCVSANYRLTSFPDYVVDAKRVLAWVQEQGASYGADPSVVFVAGNSAGGYLASFAALTPNQPEYQPGFEGIDTSVTAAVCQYGYYGTTAGDPRSTPAAHVSEEAPPFLVVHGDRDTMVPVEWTREFVAELKAASREPVVYMELPDAQHTFDYFNSLRAQLVAERIEAFAGWVRSRANAR
ncbi:acetyl esterase/lipase [Arthrobacter pigmenti]|uniref:Acetyl esterase/lipase n=1 Tax=Arthrobacter pigmenti TaxID=271432 RepID=A0A846RXL6_9MICC|nr:alpha/beta hydrolase [Arthrobacter pigmenti]NJC23726.1 acetyl esterase/lipase [Arthrobacter pigmenti]